MPLKDTNCRNAKPQDKPYRLYDEQGLYLEVHPNAGRYWRLKYCFLGKEKHLALSVYPEAGLRDARRQRDDACVQPTAKIPSLMTPPNRPCTTSQACSAVSTVLISITLCQSQTMNSARVPAFVHRRVRFA